MGKETFNSQLADSARDQVVRQRLRSRGQGENNTVGNRLISTVSFSAKRSSESEAIV